MLTKQVFEQQQYIHHLELNASAKKPPKPTEEDSKPAAREPRSAKKKAAPSPAKGTPSRRSTKSTPAKGTPASRSKSTPGSARSSEPLPLVGSNVIYQGAEWEVVETGNKTISIKRDGVTKSRITKFSLPN